MNSILIANEVVEEVKAKKKPTLILKTDFEKAYDMVRREFMYVGVRPGGQSNIGKSIMSICSLRHIYGGPVVTIMLILYFTYCDNVLRMIIVTILIEL